MNRAKLNISDPLQTLFLELTRTVEYAIERNIESVYIPLIGDVDIIIRKNSFCRILAIAKDFGLLVSVTPGFGGARIFIGDNAHGIKRIDCMWSMHFRGIMLDKVNEILAARILEPDTGLYILPEFEQARVAFSIKNAYGGAPKYEELLTKHGFHVMDTQERRLWLAEKYLRMPFSSMIGFAQSMAGFLIRVIRPTGLLVYGADMQNLRNSRVVSYLFQNRVRGTSSVILSWFRSRILSEICVTNYKWLADLDVSTSSGQADTEDRIVSYLRTNRTYNAC